MVRVLIENKTKYDLNIGFRHVTILHHANGVAPGESMDVRCGSVWFTVEARKDTVNNRWSWTTITLQLSAIITLAVLATGATAVGAASAGLLSAGASATVLKAASTFTGPATKALASLSLLAKRAGSMLNGSNTMKVAKRLFEAVGSLGITQQKITQLREQSAHLIATGTDLGATPDESKLAVDLLLYEMGRHLNPAKAAKEDALKRSKTTTASTNGAPKPASGLSRFLSLRRTDASKSDTVTPGSVAANATGAISADPSNSAQGSTSSNLPFDAPQSLKRLSSEEIAHLRSLGLKILKRVSEDRSSETILRVHGVRMYALKKGEPRKLAIKIVDGQYVLWDEIQSKALKVNKKAKKDGAAEAGQEKEPAVAEYGDAEEEYELDAKEAERLAAEERAGLTSTATTSRLDVPHELHHANDPSSSVSTFDASEPTSARITKGSDEVNSTAKKAEGSAKAKGSGFLDTARGYVQQGIKQMGT